jgi:phage baseplate assembly protein W
MTVYVATGDTLLLLAQRHLGNSSRWREIAIANKLDAPYISPNAAAYRSQGKNVATIGDPLLIPTPNSVNARTPQEAENRTYHIDLGWDIDAAYDLQMLDGIPTFDRGVKNLMKAIYRVIITPPGSVPAHPEYGCKVHRHLGQTATDWRARLAALDVKEAILKDPRVQDCTVSATWNSSGLLAVTAYVTPIPPSESFTLPVILGVNYASASI